MHYRRDKEGHHYFFTLVTEQRQPLLTLPENIDRLREAFRREKAKHPFEIEAVVILPEHLHCLWLLPEGDADFSGRWARIKRYFSIGCVGATLAGNPSRLAKREKPVWQRRFWEHRIRDEADWRRHLDYIHYNPVKHGHVNDPWAWPHSSLRKCAARGWYPEGWGASEPDLSGCAAGE
ncbi:MAG: transposase [Pseudomonadota bacterium]|nr:transposase [Pseudomonadota bacterium]